MEVIALELLPVPTSAIIKSGERVVDKRQPLLLNALEAPTQSLSTAGAGLKGARICIESDGALDPEEGTFPGFWITATAAIRTMIPSIRAIKRPDVSFIF